jgi:hypothetical protein
MGNVGSVGSSPSPAPTSQVDNSKAASDPQKAKQQVENKDQSTVKMDAQTASDLKSEKGMEASARQAQIQNTPNLPDTLDAAKKAGLKKEEVNELEWRLKKMTDKEREQELRFLNGNVLGTACADRGLRTYLELQQLKSANPSRISGETVRTLTRGVTEHKTNTSEGREGVLGQQQAVDAAKTMMRMPQGEFDRLQTTLAQAGQKDGKPIPGASPYTERALILKAVAARDDQLSSPGAMDRHLQSVNKPGQSMQEIQKYADEIRGTPRQKLIEQSTVLDPDGGNPNGMMQRFHDSCGPTVSQMARAEADPIYAKQLHENPVYSGDSTSPIADEQKKLLEDHGGKAVAVSNPQTGSVGLDTKPLEDTLNEHAGPTTNQEYKAHNVSDGIGSPEDKRSRALNNIESRLKSGADVPIGVKWKSGSGHIMLMSDVRGKGPNQEFLVSDPKTGQSSWIKRSDIESGNTQFIPNNSSEGSLDMYM